MVQISRKSRFEIRAESSVLWWCKCEHVNHKYELTTARWETIELKAGFTKSYRVEISHCICSVCKPAVCIVNTQVDIGQSWRHKLYLRVPKLCLACRLLGVFLVMFVSWEGIRREYQSQCNKG